MADIWLASSGCEHPGWENTFYPDDLPEDWRFSYYSNEFSALFLRYANWTALSEDTLQQWMDDCDPDFQFMLELDLAAYSDSDFSKLQVLQAQLAVLVLRGEAEAIEQASAQWRDRLNNVTLFADPLSAASSSLPQAQYLDDPKLTLQGNLLYLRCAADNRQLAGYLKHILANAPGALIIDGESPNIELLRQAEGLLPFFLAES